MPDLTEDQLARVEADSWTIPDGNIHRMVVEIRRWREAHAQANRETAIANRIGQEMWAENERLHAEGKPLNGGKEFRHRLNEELTRNA